MVALDKQFFHHGTKPRSSVRWRDESWQAGKTPDHRTADILSVRRHRDTSGSSNTSCANEIIYCGYRFDPETQLYYVRNRTYNPVLGRWIQRDPIGYEGGINLYGYVGGRGTSMADSTGLQVVSPGYFPPAPLINPAAAEAAQALLALLAGELEWSWLPDVIFAAAVTAAAVLAWEITCRSLYKIYKAACADVANHPCFVGMFCDECPAAIASRLACATGRAAYLNAGCDIMIPTSKNHPAAMQQAFQALENCEADSTKCVQRPACTETGID